MDQESIIVTRELRKVCGEISVIDGLNLEVPRGSICGLLGRNGAGKTTLLKMFVGLTSPTSGEGRIFGLRIDRSVESIEIRQSAAFVSEDKMFPGTATVAEIIRFTRAFYPKWRSELEQQYLRTFDLSLKTPAGKLSKGARCRLALLLAMARGADLLLLDEPTAGLDPAIAEQSLQALVSLAGQQEITVLFASHQIAEVEQIADRVCMIEKGRIVLNDSLDELKSSYRRVQFVFEGKPPAAAFENSHEDGRTLSLLVKRNPDDVVARGRLMGAQSVDVAPVTLKDIFLEHMNGAGK